MNTLKTKFTVTATDRINKKEFRIYLYLEKAILDEFWNATITRIIEEREEEEEDKLIYENENIDNNRKYEPLIDTKIPERIIPKTTIHDFTISREIVPESLIEKPNKNTKYNSFVEKIVDDMKKERLKYIGDNYIVSNNIKDIDEQNYLFSELLKKIEKEKNNFEENIKEIFGKNCNKTDEINSELNEYKSVLNKV